jgi:sporulenol synthase
MKKNIFSFLFLAVVFVNSLTIAHAQNDSANAKKVYETIDLMAQKLMAQQQADGRFEAPFEADPGFELLSLVLLKKYEKRDREIEKAFIRKAMNKWHSPSGFGSYPYGPYNHDVTGLVLISIEELGYSLKDLGLVKLKQKFETNGGKEALNLGTKILLAPLGLSSTGALEPLLRPALLNLPSFMSVSVKKLGIFRSLLIPLVSWNYLKKLDNKSQIKSQTAVDGIQWILDHQMSNGTWYTLFHAIVNIGALEEAQRLGLGNYRPQILKALKAVKRWRTKNFDGDIAQQLTLTTGWDTPQTLIAMSELPERLKQEHSGQINNAIKFLDKNQVTVKGDWSINSPDLAPGGWSFIVENTDYPDTDVVAAVLEGKHAFPEVSSDKTFNRGLHWLINLQNNDGGYPAWEKGISKTGDALIKTLFSELPDYSDLSQADVTSRISRLVYKLIQDPHTSEADKEVLTKSFMKSCKFIHNTSIDGTYWKGRWLVAFLYGTSEALDTLASTNCGKIEKLGKTVEWLLSKQNSDGGFGEDHKSYDENKFVSRKSTVMQTSYVVHGLIAYEENHHRTYGKFSPYKPKLDRAMKYLMNKANAGQGFIIERSFTGVIGAKLWYSDYSLSPQFMTLRALGRYYKLIN